MDTLLLRLIAPMQAWGVQSRYNPRDTGREPSKSGVIGLLCAALGRPRWQSVADLAVMRMGVRVDREGRLQTDYQTVCEPVKSVSQRDYLAGAAFLVGLEGDLALLEELYKALQQPRWMLYLGRKAFPPAEPIWLPNGLRRGEHLLLALNAYPRLTQAQKDGDAKLRLVLDDPQNGEQVISDVPVSFAERRFLPRRVHTLFADVPLGTGG